MLVKEWMAANPVVIDENTSIMKASQLMKEHGFRRIPVVRGERLVGIVSDRDIKEAAPSKATTLDVHELYYLLSEIKVKDIMTKDPITLRETDSVEKAAVIMLENKISGLPVVDERGQVIGIITQSDIFKVLISITGIYHSPIQLAFELEETPGSLKDLICALKNYDVRIVSVLTSQETAPPGMREIYIRIKDMKESELTKMLDELKRHFKVLYVLREELGDIPKKASASAP